MKTITAYTSDKGDLLYRKRSEAFSFDIDRAINEAVDALTNISPHTPAGESVHNALLKMLDRNVSPGKLGYAYRKLWRMKKLYNQYVHEEDEEERNQTIPF